MIFLILLLAGCNRTVWFPPDLWARGDSGLTWDPPAAAPEGIRLDQVEWGCTTSGRSWVYRARATGWVGAGYVDIFRTSDDRSEDHAMRIVASEPGGAWDELQAGPLPHGVPPAEQLPDVDSQFHCDTDASRLTIVMRIFDADHQLLDCVVDGADPPGAVARIRALDPNVQGSCREL